VTVDRYSTAPKGLKGISSEERSVWSDSPQILERAWPDLAAEDVECYFVENDQGSSDKQLSSFLAKLGTPFEPD